MKLKVFIASAIDEDQSRGQDVRDRIGKIIRDCGHEVLGAGIGDNPIIATDSSKALCRVIARHDLMEQGHAHVTITVIDGKTPVVGTPIEFYNGWQCGQYSIVYAVGCQVNSIFIKAFADVIVHSEMDLREILQELMSA